MGEQNGTVEVENALGKVKLTGATSNMVVTLIGAIGSVVTAVLLYTHMGDTRDAGRDLVAAMREAAQATREQNCLIATPMERRETMRDTCKSISR